MSHITVAASEEAFEDLFAAIRDNFTFSASDSGDFGPFTASYSLALHLEGGTVDLRADNTVSIKELDVKWDTLTVTIGFDIPEICIGGWCIIPTPFGCALRVPKVCAFSADPDITNPLDLSGVVTSEISVVASLVTRYFVDPARPPGMTPVEAQNAGIPNKWQVFLDPETADIDFFDVADIVGDLLENAVTAAVEALLPGPDFVDDIILGILGPIIDLIRDILDLPDDIQEWFSDLLGVSFGLLDLIATAVADYFAAQYPIFAFEDPFPILPAVGGLIPVKIPIEDFTVRVDDDEMVVEANVGA
jgi:hypothetical protein